MASELRLIGGDALDSDSHLARDIFEDFVHEEERISAQRHITKHARLTCASVHKNSRYMQVSLISEG
jgi:hypothetical protein